MKKYFAELVGTFVLTFLGCGAAVALGCGAENTAAIVGTAMAFGLSVIAMAYTIGGISGCHINPAITLGVFLNGGISAKDCGMYMLFQVIGAILAAAVLAGIVATDPSIVITTAMQNKGYGKEALLRSVEYGFNEVGLERIYLIVYADNARAIHVYEECGFTEYDRTDVDIFMHRMKNG